MQRRIIYVTGMKPKPEPALHRRELVRVLAASLGRIDARAARWLERREENFRLVSWTHLLYPVRREIALDQPGIEALLAQPVATAADKREIDAFGLRFRREKRRDSYTGQRQARNSRCPR